MLKILHLLYDHVKNPWVGGGGAVRAHEINKRLAQKGHSITIVSGRFPDAIDYFDKNFCCLFVGIGLSYPISVFSYIIYVVKYLKQNYNNYDLIIEDFAPWNPIFSKIFRSNSILQLHHREGFNILKKYNLLGIPFYLIEVFYPKWFRYILTVSEETKTKFNVKATVISNGIHITQSDRIRLGNYLLYVGRIDVHNKGLDLLLNATLALKQNLTIIGKGKDEKRMKQLIDKHGLGSYVKYKGYLDEEAKNSAIGNSRLLVLPSRFEGQGIVALEAAAMGKPVVVSDIPELKYVVDNGFGISFRKGDSEDLAEKIRYLWDRPDLIREMGERGKKYASQFTWDRIADEYERYLYQVLNQS